MSDNEDIDGVLDDLAPEDADSEEPTTLRKKEDMGAVLEELALEELDSDEPPTLRKADPRKKGGKVGAFGDLAPESMDSEESTALRSPDQDEGPTSIYVSEEVSKLIREVNESSLVEEEAVEEHIDGDLVRELSTIISSPRLPAIDDEVADEPSAAPEPRAAPGEAPDATLPQSYWKGLAIRLRREADVAAPRRAAELLYELGQIYEDRFELADEALTCYRASHRRAPELGLASRALCRILTRRGNHTGLREVLDAELEEASSAGEQAAILVARARLNMNLLSDLDAATEDLTRVVGLERELPVASDMLEVLYRRTGAVAGQEALLRRRLEIWKDPSLRAAIYCDLARLAEDNDNDLSAAARCYREAVELVPAHTHALRALLRICRATKDYPEAARLYETLAEIEDGPAAASSLCNAARILADHLGELERATRCLERAAELVPDDLVIYWDLATILERGERWPRLAAVLEAAAEQASNSDDAAVVSYWLAQIQLERLGDPSSAIATLQDAVGRVPEHTPSRRMLGQLLVLTGRTRELIELMTRELDLFSEPRARAMTWCRMGSVLEQEVDDLERAREVYEQALRLVPDHRPAALGLIRVLTATGQSADLAGVYEDLYASVDDGGEKIRFLEQIASLYHHRLGDMDAAVDAYERMLEVDPSSRLASGALRQIFSDRGEKEALVRVMRREASLNRDPKINVAALVEVGALLEEALPDSAAALKTYLDVLDIDPACAPAYQGAGRLLRRSGEHARLLELHRRELEHCPDTEQRGWLQMKIGRLLSDELEAPVEAADAYLAAMAQTTRTQILADQLIPLWRGREDKEALLQKIIQLPLPDAARARALHHQRVAELMTACGHPASHVEERLRHALAVHQNLSAVQQLIRLCAGAGDRAQLVDFHLLEAKLTSDQTGQILVRHRLARIWALAETELSHAVGALTGILHVSQGDMVILQQVRGLLGRLGRWGDLADVLARMRANCEQPEYQAANMADEVALLLDHPGRLGAAAELATRIFSDDPTNLQALHALEICYRADQNTDGLSQVLTRYCSLAQTSPERAALLTSLASLQAKTGNLDQSAALFRAAAGLKPQYLPAVHGLAWITRASGDDV